MTTRLQEIEQRIAEIDAFFANRWQPGVTLAAFSGLLLERWALSIERDELRAEHARMTASFDTCNPFSLENSKNMTLQRSIEDTCT